MSLDMSQPFTRKQALAAGISPKRLRGPDFQPLLTGVYISSSVRLTAALRAKGALAVHPPGAVATHFSCARVVGAPVPDHATEHVTVARAKDRRQRLGVRCHVATIPEDELRLLNGIRVTNGLRLFLDMAGLLPLVDLVVLGDWLVAKGHTTPAALAAYCRDSSDKHAVAARHGAGCVRDGVDSPMETRLRMLIVLAGLPEPKVNLVLRGADGRVVRRLDLCYEAVRLAVEYDGRHHVELLEQWESDSVRRDDLEDGSWRLLTVTSRGIFGDPEETVWRVYRALRKAGWPNLPRPSEEWRIHFTGRPATVRSLSA